jgi:hypothetical protein
VTNQAPDPLQQDLDEVWRLHQLLAAKVEPSQGEGGRRTPPASRPPLQVDPVSLMEELRRYLGWWIAQARWNLQPVKRIDITARTGVTCPYCAVGKLVGWLRGDDPEHPGRVQPDEVICLNRTADQHATEGAPWRWTKDEWARLGVLTGVREDRRFGARLPDLHES